jgi:hypothetical protein
VLHLDRIAFACLLVSSISACGSNVLTHQTNVSDVTDMSTVKVDGDGACDGTFFVDWPEGVSARISSAANDGLVVVRRKGCKLEVLDKCHGGGSYDFVDVSPSRDRTEVSADNAIAIGVVGRDDKRIGAEAGLGSARAIEYAIVGQRVAKAAATEITGECSGATHVVTAISVGAFELATSEHSEVSAIIKLHEHKGEEHHRAGDVERCSKHDAKGSDECVWPIKLDLAPAPK